MGQWASLLWSLLASQGHTAEPLPCLPCGGHTGLAVPGMYHAPSCLEPSCLHHSLRLEYPPGSSLPHSFRPPLPRPESPSVPSDCLIFFKVLVTTYFVCICHQSSFCPRGQAPRGLLRSQGLHLSTKRNNYLYSYQWSTYHYGLNCTHPQIPYIGVPTPNTSHCDTIWRWCP